MCFLKYSDFFIKNYSLNIGLIALPELLINDCILFRLYYIILTLFSLIISNIHCCELIQKELKVNIEKSIYDRITFIVDNIYSAVIISIGMYIQGYIFNFAPKPIDYIMYIINSSIILSWYVYEIQWCVLSYTLEHRILEFERHKIFFILVGIPFVLLIELLNFYISYTTSWNIIFPLYVIFSLYNKPVEIYKSKYKYSLMQFPSWISEKFVYIIIYFVKRKKLNR